MTSFLALLALDILGLAGLWLYVRARLRRALELEGLLGEIRKEVRVLNIEINETADRNISLLEDRMDSLRSLLDEADRRMGVVRKELSARAAEREVYSHLGRPRPRAGEEAQGGEGGYAGFAPAAPGPGPRPAERLEPRPEPRPEPRAAGGEDAEGRLPEAAGAEEPIRLELSREPRRPPEIRRASESVIPPRPLRERAIELHRKGFSPDIIAARLGATVAEIELLVSLEESLDERRGSAED